MSGSLAARLGMTLETVPAGPYIAAPHAWPLLGEGLNVGLMTRGNPTHENDANRSLPEDAARRLRDLPVRTFDLDPAATGARDFADTAALLERLDLVISVDTAVAHLAGAMGRPGWVLLPAVETDWRWLRGRRDSPWYPSLTLYRQGPGEGWGPVIDRVVADLEAYSRSRQQGTSEPGQGVAS